LAAGKTDRDADELSCALTVPQKHFAGVRCVAIHHRCRAGFYANYCGDKLMSAKWLLMLLVPLSGEASCRRNAGGKEYQFIVLLLSSEQIKNILASL
jgi:hypothetical protein